MNTSIQLTAPLSNLSQPTSNLKSGKKCGKNRKWNFLKPRQKQGKAEKSSKKVKKERKKRTRPRLEPRTFTKSYYHSNNKKKNKMCTKYNIWGLQPWISVMILPGIEPMISGLLVEPLTNWAIREDTNTILRMFICYSTIKYKLLALKKEPEFINSFRAY